MSPFQQQYPLSPKKFTKKMLGQVVNALVFALILGIPSGLISTAALSQHLSFGALVGSAILSASLIFIFFMLVGAWYWGAYIRNYFYEGGDNFITIKKGVFAPKEIHVQYAKIQDVYVDQDILDRIMGLYDVHIASATAASGMEAHIDGVSQTTAEGLKNFFLAKIQGVNAPAPSVPGAASMAPAAEGSAPVQFSGEISNTTYPIQGAWLPMSIFGNLFSGLFIAVFIVGYAWAKSGGSLDATYVPLFVLVVSVVFIALTVSTFIWRGNYKFSFLPEYIEYQTGVFSLSNRHLPYKSIQDVSVNRTFFERIFGLATVLIENAAQMTVQTKYGARSISMGVKLVGLTPEGAAKVTEELKKVILSKDSSRMGL